MNINDQKIIDTHHHLWDPNTKKYDWLTSPGHEVFNKVYLLKDFNNDFEDLNIIKSVHVQAEINLENTVYESEWLQKCSDDKLNNKHLPNAIIGFANFLDSNVEATLEKHKNLKNFRGIRQILNFDKNNKELSHAEIDFLKEDSWIKNFSLLQKYDLTFDLSILFGQAEDAASLVNKYDNTLFIVNHTLSPVNLDKVYFKEWLEKIKLLSKFDNVVIKLSGFGEFNSNWTKESIKPLILNCIDFFKIERCMFGSNFPVDKFLSNAKYVDYWQAYFDILNDFTTNDKDKIFYLNAEKYYKI